MRKIFLTSILLSLLLVGCSCSNPSTSSEDSTPSSSESIDTGTNSSSSSSASSESSSSSESFSSSEDKSESSSNISSESSSSSSGDSSSSSGSSSSSSSSSSEEIVPSLNSPVITIDEETGVVTWQEVEGATHYNYIINDGELKTTLNRTISLNDQENISVQASNETTCSMFSKALTYYDTSDIVVSNPKKVKVYFHDSNINPVSVNIGETISKPNNPSKDLHTFDDWYEDPFYQTKFDFSSPITEKTVVYANWVKDDFIDNTYYWVKACPKITSSLTSKVTSSKDWKFVPLKVNEGQNEFKEFYCNVTVTGASETDPATFIVMDGLDDNQGRTYWKKGDGTDFTIKSDGTYAIYFSAEHQYAASCHIAVGSVINAGAAYINNSRINEVNTPGVVVNNTTNVASWMKDSNATSYEIVINNGDIQNITNNEVSLKKGEHISVRCVYSDGSRSNWSIPKANINVVTQDNVDPYAYVYFYESGTSSTKVEKGTQINAHNIASTSEKSLEGWYLEPSLKTKVTFPYTVNESVVFYPKWTYTDNPLTKDYYNLVDASGKVIDGFIWNLDNYEVDEYEVKNLVLEETTYFVKSLDGTKTYETFSIGKRGTYSVYFSLDKLWDDQTTPRHVFIRHEKIDIYFSNNYRWTGTMYAYLWNKTTNEPKVSWPGVEMEFVETNSYGEDIYKVQVDLVQYNYVIFTNNSNQTVDISISNTKHNTGYYISGESSGKYKVGTYTYSAS